MNSAERIRAYLTARAQDPPAPMTDAFFEQGFIARHGEHYLREADLETVLQMLDLLAILIAGRSRVTDDPISQEYVLMKAERQVTGQ